MFTLIPRVGKYLCLVGSVSLLAACASFGEQGTPEQIVSQRSQAYWDARIQGKPEKAYRYTNAAFRQLIDEKEFVSTRRTTFAKAAEVKKASCDADRCEVGVNLKVNPPVIGQKNATIDMYATEVWLLEDGQWSLYLEP